MWRRGKSSEATDSDCAVRVAVATARWAATTQSIDAVTLAAVAILGLDVALASGALAAASVLANTIGAREIALILAPLAAAILGGFFLAGPLVMSRGVVKAAAPTDEPGQETVRRF